MELEVGSVICRHDPWTETPTGIRAIVARLPGEGVCDGHLAVQDPRPYFRLHCSNMALWMAHAKFQSIDKRDSFLRLELHSTFLGNDFHNGLEPTGDGPGKSGFSHPRRERRQRPPGKRTHLDTAASIPHFSRKPGCQESNWIPTSTTERSHQSIVVSFEPQA